MKYTIALLSLLFIGCHKEQQIPNSFTHSHLDTSDVTNMFSGRYLMPPDTVYGAPYINSGTNIVLTAVSEKVEYMIFRNLEGNKNFHIDLRSVEVCEASQNMVMHTKLHPVVTQTNDTYYIEFKKE